MNTKKTSVQRKNQPHHISAAFRATAFYRLLAMSAFALFASSAHALIIDDFDSSGGAAASTSAMSVSSFTNANPGEQLVGGQRDFQATITGFSSNFDRVVVTSGAQNPLDARMRTQSLHSQDAGATGYSLLTYDGVDDSGSSFDPMGLGQVDLTADGNNAFTLELALSDRSAPVTIFVFTSPDEWSWMTAESPDSFGHAEDPILLELLYEDFTPGTTAMVMANGSPVSQLPQTAIAGADFSRAGALAILFDGTDRPGFDIGINQFSAESVPVPGTLLLLMAGVIGTGRMRRAAKA